MTLANTFISIDRNRGGGRTHDMLVEVIACTIPGPRFVFCAGYQHGRNMAIDFCQLCKRLGIGDIDMFHRKGWPTVELEAGDAELRREIHFVSIDRFDRMRGWARGALFVDHHAQAKIVERWLGQIRGPVEVVKVDAIRPGAPTQMTPGEVSYRQPGWQEFRE